ncbi:Peptidase S8 family with Protease-associated domain [Klebsormidium nitens]|uniref:Peptidase S8 family with Protease-associated domain n=1 Tax=Klebsormidium nitens TaxID=105231 RepID=A0A1Y1HZ07_KLENI|nr:Peptidase S8 family with Protease-associated domain [Klebsormidium nitens]|eukprot:GAQ81098.1 Peptidase S8 family with Protease-associated domain [Klebsormidium nitens]
MDRSAAFPLGKLILISLCIVLWAPQSAAWLPKTAHKFADAPHIRLRSVSLRVLDHPELLLGSDSNVRSHRSMMESVRRELAQANTTTGGFNSSVLEQLGSPPIQVMVTLSAAAMLQPDTFGKLNDAAGAVDSSVLGYLPEDSYLLLCPNTTAAKKIQAALPAVVWMGVYDPSHKMAPEWIQISQVVTGGSSPVMSSGGDAGAESVAIDDLSRVLIDVRLPGSVASGADVSTDLAGALAAQWNVSLNVYLKANCKGNAIPAVVTKAARDVVTAATPSMCLNMAVAWLAGQPWAHWVGPRPVTRLHNMYSSSLTQSSMALALSPGVTDGVSYGTARPVWDAGIMGQNQIVGMGDSGVDWNSCYFVDPAVPVPGPTHRKVVGYRQLSGGDNLDGEGHGTHVCGSICGQAGDLTPSQYDGMAPKARVFVSDMGTGNVGYINPPSDLNNDYFKYAYAAGARIHSDSWGTSDASYSSMSQDVDQFTWTNQDFLPVIAAGNSGAQHNYGPTIYAPATAKNALTVGATWGPFGQSVYKEPAGSFIMTVTGPALDLNVFKVFNSGFGTDFKKLTSPLTAAAAVPQDACSGLTNAAAVKGKVVLLDRGTCLFSVKIQNAQTAGAAAVLIMNTDAFPPGYFSMSAGTAAGSVNIPAGSLPKAIGAILYAALKGKTAVQLSFAVDSRTDARYDNVASFSSVGPTQDGRIKPEITSPGDTVRSAKSSGLLNDQTCSQATMSGTSMATPITAGSAALVRQYYTDGWYPTGKATPSNRFQPSGALVKATLINGAALMGGVTGDGWPIDLPPSMTQGFGRTFLANSLKLPNTAWSMFVRNGTSVQTSSGQRYCVSVGANSGDLKVTLVWHDAPALLTASTVLVNDLDLVVTSPSGRVFLGNGQADRMNNVEQVWVRTPEQGVYFLDVNGYKVPIGKTGQPFALVARGPLKEVACYDAHVSGGPSGFTNNRSPVFYISATAGANLVLQCRLQCTPSSSSCFAWKTCTSPVTLKSLPDAAYTFSVQIIDTKYGMQSTPSSQTFTVLTKPPSTTLMSSDAPSNAATATFTFTSPSANVASYQCQLNGTNLRAPPADIGTVVSQEGRSDLTHGWQPCFTPETYQGQFDGDYIFSVRAVDLAGNVDPKPPTFSWSVNTLQPSAKITQAPGLYTNNSSPVFAFTLSKAPGITPGVPEWNCRLTPGDPGAFQKLTSSEGVDGEEAQAAAAAVRLAQGLVMGGVNPNLHDWAPCKSPVNFTGLPDGAYAFSVRAIDTQGANGLSNASATVDFSVNTVPPRTAVLSQPPALAAATSAAFYFISSEPVTYLCELRSAYAVDQTQSKYNQTATIVYSWRACLSPISFLGLQDGSYTLLIQATDLAGNGGATMPLVFGLDSTAPTQTITSATVQTGTLLATFSGADGARGSGVVSFQCRLVQTGRTAPGFTPCTSPSTYSNLFWGQYNFQVKAVDAAGNVAGSPDEYNFTIANAGVSGQVVSWMRAPFPAKISSRTAAAIAFDASGADGLTPTPNLGGFECSLDSGSVLACTSPRFFNMLSEGEHVFRVRGKDTKGAAGPWNGYSWIVDTQAPSTAITSPKSLVLNTISPVFTLSGDDGATGTGIDHFECKLEAQGQVVGDPSAAESVSNSTGMLVNWKLHDWQACGVSTSFQQLPNGLYRFSARAVDEAGNADPSPDFRDFLVNKWVVELEAFSASSSPLVLPPSSDVVQCDQGAPSCQFTVGLDGAAVSAFGGRVIALFPGSPSATFPSFSLSSGSGALLANTISASLGPGQPPQQFSLLSRVVAIQSTDQSTAVLSAPGLLMLQYSGDAAAQARRRARALLATGNATDGPPGVLLFNPDLSVGSTASWQQVASSVIVTFEDGYCTAQVKDLGNYAVATLYVAPPVSGFIPSDPTPSPTPTPPLIVPIYQPPPSANESTPATVMSASVGGGSIILYVIISVVAIALATGVAGCVLVCKRRQPSKAVSMFAPKAPAFADTPNDSPRSAQPMRRRKSRKSGTHFELPQDSPGGSLPGTPRGRRFSSGPELARSPLSVGSIRKSFTDKVRKISMSVMGRSDEVMHTQYEDLETVDLEGTTPTGQ